MSSQQQQSPVPHAGPHEQAHTIRLHNGLGTSERTLMCLHVVLQLPDMRSKTKEKQEIIFSHHPTRRTRTRSMFPAFSSSIITIVGHQVSEETSDKTDMVTQGITHSSLAKIARSRATNRNTPPLETSSPHHQKKGYSTHARITWQGQPTRWTNHWTATPTPS